ncbi:hypothetical protein TAMA11512_18280 [Selenomonas sp. TAMA-11512]|uniref:hypothetical protein n=1 Tax=Selenomonas sp. TAMA-11512 TaxID=3095337 RepID=UPI003092422F|nr:hypothetical protein TAMA11512_18280 [Selenomonas sp. TAMA-11512]
MKEKKVIGYYVLDVKGNAGAEDMHREIEVPDRLTFAQLAYVLHVVLGYKTCGEVLYYSKRPKFVIYDYEDLDDDEPPLYEGTPYGMDMEYICDFFAHVRTMHFRYQEGEAPEKSREYTIKVKSYKAEKRYAVKVTKASGGMDTAEINRVLEERCRLNYRAYGRERFPSIWVRMEDGHYGVGARYREPFDINPKTSLPESVIEEIHRTFSVREEELLLRQILKDAVDQLPTANPPRLLDILSGFTKEELLTVLDNKEVDVKRGMPRIKLAELLTREMLAPGVLRRYYLLLSDHEVKTLRRYLKNPNGFKYREDKDDFTILFTACYIASTPTGAPAVAQDVAAALKELDTPAMQEERQRRSWLLTCLAAADFLYGVTPLSLLVELYEMGGHGSITKRELIRYIQEIPTEYTTGEIDHDRFISDSIAGEEAQIIIEMQEGKPFYVPASKEEIMEFSIGEGLQGEEETANVEKCFAAFGYEPDEVYDVMERTCWNFLSGAPVSFVLDSLKAEGYTDAMGKAEKRTLEHMLTRLYETTRSIANRGNTPLELQHAAEAKRTARQKTKSSKVVFLKDRKK